MLNAGGVQIATKYHQCKVIRLGLACFSVFPRQKQRPPNGRVHCVHCAISDNGSRIIKNLLGASWNLWTTLCPKAVLSHDYMHISGHLHVQIPVRRICPKLDFQPIPVSAKLPAPAEPEAPLYRTLGAIHLKIWRDHPKQQEFQASRIVWYVWFVKGKWISIVAAPIHILWFLKWSVGHHDASQELSQNKNDNSIQRWRIIVLI